MIIDDDDNRDGEPASSGAFDEGRSSAKSGDRIAPPPSANDAIPSGSPPPASVGRTRRYEYSLKDMWMHSHQFTRAELLCAVLRCAAVLLVALLIAATLTRAAYRLSGSSLSVNRPIAKGGAWGYRERLEHIRGHRTANTGVKIPGTD